ncbi:plexin domain-containing protein 2 isoform X1 [Drosophila busckii]|uniref:plexin domain-containing protein 2 isoform X1 n=1 Tax=Drosophila busckii TaxID=30019 RepID=UPI00083F47A7|nr:plexin domain-containing protein 2 isoform X1 [Drosophila busckii]
MAKSLSCACAHIAIFLTIYGSIQCVKSISGDAYNNIATQLTYIQPDEIVQLTPAQLLRQRRAAPITDAAATSGSGTQDLKTQYQSVSASANVNSSVASGDGKPTVMGSISYNVGVNGAGQRKEYGEPSVNSSSNSSSSSSSSSSSNTTINMPIAPTNKAHVLGAQQPPTYPKKVAPSLPSAMSTERSLNDDVDVSEDVIAKGASNASLTRREDHFDYYNSTTYVNKDEAAEMLAQMRNIPENPMLSASHRRAMTVELKFDFPFYGHYLRNVTVATGGFIYTGDYVHSWLAATQYIAPLMANFDTNITQHSYVRLNDNGTALTVFWDNVPLQDRPDLGTFTFSATLHKNGDIVFGYYQLPMLIHNIQDNQHPVKVGLSDAYIVDKMLYFARRKTIYEYDRVTLAQKEIVNSTIIRITALPTCRSFYDCQSCADHNVTMNCAWCPSLNRCSTSTGNDRKKQEWQQKGCDRSAITHSAMCPAIGQQGNNAAAQETSSNNNNNNSNSNKNGAATGGSSTPANSISSSATESTLSSTQQPTAGAGASSSSSSASHEAKQMDEGLSSRAAVTAANDNKNVGAAFGVALPICLVFVVTLWLFYAYRNPHTRSGQLLIQSKHLHQFRPSQWSWRRGEARYTAATIHM